MLACPPDEVQAALDMLVTAGQIEQLPQVNGAVTYVAHRYL